MIWVFAAIGLVAVVVIGLLVLGRETERLAHAPRSAVFDLPEAVDFIADGLPPASQARLSHEDVRWILLADADLLEEATAQPEGRFPWSRVAEDPGPEAGQIDQDEAVARILARADETDRGLADEDVVAVLAGRLRYLEAIGAVGPEA